MKSKPSRARVIAATKGALRGRGKLRSYGAVPSLGLESLSHGREAELKARLKRARTATVKPKSRLPNPAIAFYRIRAKSGKGFSGPDKRSTVGGITTRNAALQLAQDYANQENVPFLVIKVNENTGQESLVRTISPKKHNPMFGPESVKRAKRVKTISRPGQRRVIHRDTAQRGEIIGVQPGGFVKVKWADRERPTLIKRSEIKRHHLKMNPGLMELAGGLQAADYLLAQAGLGPKKTRRRNPVSHYMGQGDASRVYLKLLDRVYKLEDSPKTAANTRALKVARDRVRRARIAIDKWETTKAYGSRIPNPTVKEMSERFQGRATGKAQEFYASDSAPRLDFSRAGKLVFLKLAGTTVRAPGAVVAIDPKTEKLWIANSVKRGLFTRKAQKGQLLDYGAVDAICYLTAKSHIGNGKTFEYVHMFGEEGGRKPRLLIDHDGMPILRGGSYKIEDRGIVN